jgi:hypothetical protein
MYSGSDFLTKTTDFLDELLLKWNITKNNHASLFHTICVTQIRYHFTARITEASKQLLTDR